MSGAATVKLLPATDLTPSFFGAYGTYQATTMENSFPSPIAINPAGGSPTSMVFPVGAGLGWSAPNSGYFHDTSNRVPGTVGPVRYWPTNAGSFKGKQDAYIEVDSGLIFNDW